MTVEPGRASADPRCMDLQRMVGRARARNLWFAARDGLYRWAMPTDVAGKDNVYVGRIRKDLSQDNTLEMWVVGDQLLKGAALNAVQCGEAAIA